MKCNIDQNAKRISIQSFIYSAALGVTGFRCLVAASFFAFSAASSSSFNRCPSSNSLHTKYNETRALRTVVSYSLQLMKGSILYLPTTSGLTTENVGLPLTSCNCANSRRSDVRVVLSNVFANTLTASRSACSSVISSLYSCFNT